MPHIMPEEPSSPPAILALPGPQYWFDFDGDGANGQAPKLIVGGEPLQLVVEGNQGRGTGWSVWDGAACLALHLDLASESLRKELENSGGIVELGSGTGLAGIAAAMALRLPTLLTDLPEVLPSLRRNAGLNKSAAGLISVQPLNWKQAAEDWREITLVAAAEQGPLSSSPPGLVIAADCVWLEELVVPFVRALEAVAAAHPGTRVLMAYQSRSQRVDDVLFSLLEESFRRSPVPLLPGEKSRGLIELYTLRAKTAG